MPDWGEICLGHEPQRPNCNSSPIKGESLVNLDPEVFGEVVKKYLSRWYIEVSFKEAKQRLGLGQEQGRFLATQVFSVVQTFCRCSLLAYRLEQEEGRPPWAICYANWNRRLAKSLF